MSLQYIRCEKFENLETRIRGTAYAAAELLTSIVSETSLRLSLPSQTGNSARLDRFILYGAFTDAALLLIEIELPQFKLRRMTYDEGKWYCALSRQRELPDWLDQSVEASHADLSLAIASAFIEALRTTRSLRVIGQPSVPACRPKSFETLSCENFI